MCTVIISVAPVASPYRVGDTGLCPVTKSIIESGTSPTSLSAHHAPDHVINAHIMSPYLGLAAMAEPPVPVSRVPHSTPSVAHSCEHEEKEIVE